MAVATVAAGQPGSSGTSDDSGPSLDSLSFLDLLYAVPVSDLAVRVSGSDLGRVTSADWAVLGVSMTMIILSWIGLHRNRADMAKESHHRKWISKTPFFHLRFAQFMIEVLIVGMYFALGLTLQLPTAAHPHPPLPSMSWVAGFVFLIFISYFVWDVLDVAMARDIDWREQALVGGIVTLGFTWIFGAVYGVVYVIRNTVHVTVYWSIALMVLLYLYRVSQEYAKKPWNDA